MSRRPTEPYLLPGSTWRHNAAVPALTASGAPQAGRHASRRHRLPHARSDAASTLRSREGEDKPHDSRQTSGKGGAGRHVRLGDSPKRGRDHFRRVRARPAVGPRVDRVSRPTGTAVRIVDRGCSWPAGYGGCEQLVRVRDGGDSEQYPERPPFRPPCGCAYSRLADRRLMPSTPYPVGPTRRRFPDGARCGLF